MTVLEGIVPTYTYCCSSCRTSSPRVRTNDLVWTSRRRTATWPKVRTSRTGKASPSFVLQPWAEADLLERILTVVLVVIAVLDGREWTTVMSLRRSVWDDADDEWRREFADTCRDRYEVWLRRTAGIELTQEQLVAVSVTLIQGPRETAPQFDTVTLYGGPLDGESVNVDPRDPEPGIGIIASGCAYPGGRSWYEPDSAGRWTWRRDIPWDAM
ncbi:hypothetical protein ACWC1D_12200 [Streptomyces sp. NPDC001478]